MPNEDKYQLQEYAPPGSPLISINENNPVIKSLRSIFSDLSSNANKSLTQLKSTFQPQPTPTPIQPWGDYKNVYGSPNDMKLTTTYQGKEVLGGTAPSGSVLATSTPKPNTPYFSTPTPTPTPAPIQRSDINVDPTNIDWLEQNVLPRTRSAGLPDALVAGQWAIEDRKKNSAMFNLMFGGKVHTYKDIPSNVDDYILTVTNMLRRKGYDITKMKDPQEILTIMQTGDTR
jgi:hypothetical protein